MYGTLELIYQFNYLLPFDEWATFHRSRNRPRANPETLNRVRWPHRNMLQIHWKKTRRCAHQCLIETMLHLSSTTEWFRGRQRACAPQMFLQCFLCRKRWGILHKRAVFSSNKQIVFGVTRYEMNISPHAHDVVFIKSFMDLKDTTAGLNNSVFVWRMTRVVVPLVWPPKMFVWFSPTTRQCFKREKFSQEIRQTRIIFAETAFYGKVNFHPFDIFTFSWAPTVFLDDFFFVAFLEESVKCEWLLAKLFKFTGALSVWQ